MDKDIPVTIVSGLVVNPSQYVEAGKRLVGRDFLKMLWIGAAVFGGFVWYVWSDKMIEVVLSAHGAWLVFLAVLMTLPLAYITFVIVVAIREVRILRGPPDEIVADGLALPGSVLWEYPLPAGLDEQQAWDHLYSAFHSERNGDADE